MNKRRNWIFIVPAAIIGLIVFTALGGLIVRALWNWLLPGLFGFPLITFWQAIGILALSRILFGGFGLGGGSRRYQSRRRMRERWERMTPEERERFRERMQERCGFTPP